MNARTTSASERGRASLIALAFLAALVLAAGSVLMVAQTANVLTGGQADAPIKLSLGVAYQIAAPALWFAGIAPILATALTGLLASLGAFSAPLSSAAASEPAPAPPSNAPALRLLALLQQEGRLLDFIEEDIDGYSDAQVGAAVRSIHAGCRKALHDRMTIERLFAEDDGSAIEIAAGFNSETVRLTGNVHGDPPFRGTLQHGGWRAVNVTLAPPSADLDAAVLAPAEVEIP